MITVRQMRYFETLCETLHFGRAARRLNVSQPALSAQIAHLEGFLGGPLLERRPGGAVLTAQGEALRERVTRIMGEIRELEASVGDKGGPLRGRLRLGLIATVAPYLLPSLFPRLREAHPELRCEIRESLTRTLVAAVNDGELDCAVAALPLADSSLSTIDLGEDPFLLAVPESDAPRYDGRASVQALADETLILLEEGHCLRDQALQVCRLADAGALSGLGATSLTTILQMVAGGLGATLLPSTAARAEARPGIALLPFSEPVPARSLVLAFRASTARRRDYDALAAMIRACLTPAG